MLGLYDGTCQNLLGGDKALILVPLIHVSVIGDSFSPWTCPRFKADGAKPTMVMCLNILVYTCTVFTTLHVCVIIVMASPLWLAVGRRSS